MKFAIKGMVCRHCVDAVERILIGVGLDAATIDVKLGEVDVPDDAVDADFLAAFDRELTAHGFSRILNEGDRLVEAVKRAVIEHVRHHDCRYNLSACLQEQLHTDYGALSRLFSAREGRTIEKYSIAQRVEYAKELLSYGELSISEIAWRAGYSSVAHLSRQFKNVTGMTPSEFQKLRPHRTPINEI